MFSQSTPVDEFVFVFKDKRGLAIEFVQVLKVFQETDLNYSTNLLIVSGFKTGPTHLSIIRGVVVYVSQVIDWLMVCVSLFENISDSLMIPIFSL